MISGVKAVTPHKDRGVIFKRMKEIDFGKIAITDRKLRRMIVKLLKSSLKPSVNRRVQSAENMLFEIYGILKKYNIRYARYGIHQLLVDGKLAPPPVKGSSQDIYFGFER